MYTLPSPSGSAARLFPTRTATADTPAAANSAGGTPEIPHGSTELVAVREGVALGVPELVDERDAPLDSEAVGEVVEVGAGDAQNGGGTGTIPPVLAFQSAPCVSVSNTSILESTPSPSRDSLTTKFSNTGIE